MTSKRYQKKLNQQLGQTAYHGAGARRSRKRQYVLSFIVMVVLVLLAVGVTVTLSDPDHKFPFFGSEPSIGPPEVEVSITDEGFVPDTVKIKPGTTVVWTNDTDAPHEVAADPYPSHTSLPSLFSPALKADDTYHFTFTATGTVHYHDQLYPNLTGTIVVK